MKVGLILSGHMRGYRNTFDSFKNELIDKYDVDVFISTWNTYGWWTADNIKLINHESSEIDINEINHLYGPKIIKVDKYFDDKFDERFQIESLLFQPFLKDKRIRIINTLSMYYKFQDSLRLFEDFVSENKSQYDIVIKTRPDVYLPQIPSKLLENKIYTDHGRGIAGGGTGDIFLMGTQEQILKLNSIYDSLELVVKQTDFFCPHRIMEKYLSINNIQYAEISNLRLHNARNGQWCE